MISPACEHPKTRTNGKTPSGATRFRCKACGKSWTEDTSKLDGMRIGMDKASQIVELLCEGMSVRGTARITKTSKSTILDLLQFVGERCQDFMDQEIQGVCVDDIQIDELWQYVFCKKATAKRKNYVGGCGDSYCFTAIERSTKLLVAWHMGRRDEKHTTIFIEKLARATVGRFFLSSDGWSCYPMAVWSHLGKRVDYGMLVKIFGDGDAEEQRRYSPPRIIEAKRTRVFGVPDREHICTSHCERMNGTIRTFCKRMARLTYCFSKRWGNHRAALALLFAHYNWCRKHRSLQGKTPAMAHGLTNHAWTARELLEKVIAV
jgi:transposase-like protein/IS1 family transposase